MNFLGTALLAALANVSVSLHVESTQLLIYDGPAHGEDRVTGLVADTSSNCYLCGYSFGQGSDFDFCVVKIDSVGETLWVRRYGSPFGCEDRIWASALDSDGNLIVCGGTLADSDYDWDFQIVKYSPAGDRLWTWRHDFPGHANDRPVAVATGPENSIYVTGSAEQHRAPNLSHPSRRDSDVASVRLSPAGQILWAQLFDGRARRDDCGVAVAVDATGACYVAARTVNTPPATDITILKYSAQGQLLWEHTIDGQGHSTDFPTGLLLCSDGSLLVIGSTTGDGTGFDYYIGCLDTASHTGARTRRHALPPRIRWQRTYDGAGRVDIAQAACSDSAGNIIITGQSACHSTGLDILTLSYSTSGTLRWKARYNGPGNGADHGFAAATKDNRVFVGGDSQGSNGYNDLAVLAYSTAGDTLWSYRYSSSGLGESRAVALLPLAGGICVGGYTFSPRSSFDYLLLKLPRDMKR